MTNPSVPSAGAGLFMDMGTGKTLVALSVMRFFNFPKVLVVGPKAVIKTRVWQKDMAKHFPGANVRFVELVEPLKISERARLVQNEQPRNGQQLIFLTNYQSFSSASSETLQQACLNAGFDLVVLDESHKIKKPGGKTSIFFGRLGKKVPRRMTLTGTPMPHSPLDVYAQYRFLDQNVFGTSFASFRDEYAIMGGYEGREVLGFRNQERMTEKVYSVAYRADASVLDLPEANHINRTFALSPSAQRLYREIRNDFVADVDAGRITAGNVLTRLLRFQQITSGFIPTDRTVNEDGEVSGGEIVEVDSGKAEVLEQTLDELAPREPVVVFCRFHHDIDTVRRIAEEQGRTVGELSSRRDNTVAWQNGEYDVLAVQVQSGEAGIDLTRAHYAIYYSLGYSLGDYKQSLARVHRPGQTKPVTYVHLLAERTIDEVVMESLESKSDLIRHIIDTLRQESGL